MKEALLTSLRHALTALAGLGGFLVARGAISPEDAATVDAAGASMGDALAVIAAALVARLVVWLSGKVVKNGSFGVFVLLGTLAGFGLPACSGDYPVRLGIEGPGYAADYSAKGGLVIRASVQGTK